MPRTAQLLTIALISSALCAPVAAAVGYTEEFPLERCSWSTKGTANPYFSLKPGYRIVIEGEEDGELIAHRITVLKEFRRVSFVTPNGTPMTVRTRVVEEYETEDGELVEISRNFFARCKQTGDIYYFGEDVEDYEDGELVGHGGAWLAGVDDAQPGIYMPGTFLLGSRYYQEIAPANDALDRAQHVDMGLTVPTKIGTFSGCVMIRETSPLDPGDEAFKIYCPGVGIVLDETLEIIEAGIAD